jgi:putative oxidoreductase
MVHGVITGDATKQSGQTKHGGYVMFGQAGSEPKPIIPALGRYYGLTSDLAYVLVRLTVGLMLLPHGWTKVSVGGIAGVSGYFARLHLEPALLFTLLAMFNETIGGVLIAIGLFTRPVAALLVIEFLILLFVVHIPRGYGMALNGAEFPLMWLLMLVVILLRGGGPYSLDRKIGKEF